MKRVNSMWLWIGLIVASALLAFYFDQKRVTTSAITPEDPETAATYIPAGYVLVPIEVSNYESLDSILGKFGIVDLYRTSMDSRGKSQLVASHVKILRAPLNPSHFAVLVRESESPDLVAMGGQFTVVVQNPEHGSGTSFVTADSSKGPRSAKKSKSRIGVEVMDAGS